MKTSIEGFNQSILLSFRKEVIENDKPVLKKVDCTDVIILRWFVDAYPITDKITVDGKEYAWIRYEKVLEDLPLLDITEKSLSARLKKLVMFGILDYRQTNNPTIRKGGTCSVYTFGAGYKYLINDDIAVDNAILDEMFSKEHLQEMSEKVKKREANFELFWEAYPRKEGKKDAHTAFTHVKAPIEVLLSAIEKQKTTQQWKSDKGRFIPLPATWLRGERWNDEGKESATTRDYRRPFKDNGEVDINLLFS